MFSSTVIPTIDRTTLERAVRSVLDQSPPRDDFEVIVVNDSGHDLRPADWQRSPRVRILTTNRRERSVARNTGAAVARGRYLHFLDDDDRMLPGAFERLRALAAERPAAWLYGGYEVVDSAGNRLETCHPDEGGNCFVRFMTGEWLPLQASLIDAEAFFALGGFAPLPSLLGGNEDVHLSRSLTLAKDIAGTPDLVASIRTGADESTTNYADLHRQSRQSREQVLARRGAFRRLMSSARSRPADGSYWRARVPRIYLASSLWNARRLRLLTAVCRAGQSLLSFASGGPSLLTAGFWRGFLRPHRPEGGIVHFQAENAIPVGERTAGPAE